MLNCKRILATAAMVATFVTASFAASPVGTWVGKIVLDKTPEIPAQASPAQKQQMQSMIDQIKKIRINLVVKSNKTFLLSAPAIGPQPATKAEGTWAQKGSTVTLTTTKENGKAVSGTKAKPQDFQLSANGKSLSMGTPGMGKLVFTK